MAPAAEVKLHGQDAEQTGIAVSEVRVITSVTDDTDTAVVTFANAYDEVERSLQWYSLYKLGNNLEIALGYKDKLTTVFSGYITSVQFRYPRSGTPEVVVTGMDASFKLMRGQKIRTWANKKVSDVVKEIAKEHGLTADVDDTGAQVPFIAQGHRTDFRFLQDMALAHNYEFFIVGKKLYFRKRFKSKTPILTLKYMHHLREFSLEHNLAEQVARVEVHGWDVKQQKEMVGSSGDVDKINSHSKTGANVLSSIGTNYVEHIYANPSSQGEANTLAKSIMNGRALRLVSGEGEVVGLPELRAGVFVKVEGLGKELDEAYYVPRATHLFDSSGYVTQFQVQGNAIQ